MKTLIYTPTGSREHAFFTNFKNSKRIRWSENRKFNN